MSEEKKLLLILVDPSIINMNDLVGIKNPRLEGVRVVRFRYQYWGKHEPITLYYLDSKKIKSFSDLGAFQKYFEELDEVEEQ